MGDDKPKILWVEDDEEFLQFIEESPIYSEKYQISVANSFVEALVHIDSNTYDLIITDLFLEGATPNHGIT